MSRYLEYKGYTGSLEFSAEDSLFYGKVLGIRSLVLYEGNTADSLVADFRKAIDDYLAVCEAEGIKPEKPYKGTLNIRLGEELHRRAAEFALERNETINKFIKEAVEEKLALLTEA